MFGAGKGEANTFWCEKGMVYKAIVNISAGTVKRNVYGGGKIGRVETNTQVTIGIGEGSEGGTSAPTIGDNVFGAGAGVLTHGYSALVRGNSSVTVQGNAKVGNSVYGGGELATVGKYNIAKTPALAEQHHVKIGMPYETVSGGICTVEILGHAQIGPDASGHVFGAGMGVDPTNDTYSYDDTDEETMRSSRPRRMTLKPGILPTIYDATDNDRVIWEYFDDQASYYDFLQTLALVTNTNVTIRGNASVNGSVYGGSESGFVQHNTDVRIQGSCTIGTENVIGNVYGGGLGIEGNGAAGRVSENAKVAISGGEINGSVYGGGALGVIKGGVNVNILGGTVTQDVYGGGALADTNTDCLDGDGYQLVSGLTVGESVVTGLYTKSGDVYSEITTADAKAVASTNYYKHISTTVNLLGGTISGDAYGGGKGSNTIAALVGNTKVNLNGMSVGDYKTEFSSILLAATDGNGDGEVTDKDEDFHFVSRSSRGCAVNRVFGCNNINGSPQGNVTVHVYGTQHTSLDKIQTKYNLPYYNRDQGTDEGLKDYLGRLLQVAKPEGASTPINGVTAEIFNAAQTTYNNTNATTTQYNTAITSLLEALDNLYDVYAVYGGGNNAAYEPTTPYDETHPTGSKSQVIIEGCDYSSIQYVYGGGNAAPIPETNLLIKGCKMIDYLFGGGNGTVVGADVGYKKDDSNQGTGVVTMNLMAGYIHNLFGGSNSNGRIRGGIHRQTLTSTHGETDDGCCTELQINKMYGAGKNADIEGDMIDVLGCMPGSWIDEYYGGAENANVKGNVELTITSGRFRKLFGGNKTSGAIFGHIKLNIEETGDCNVPIEIDELYLGGNEAAYSRYGYYVKTTTSEGANATGVGAPSEVAVLTNGKLTFMPRQSAMDPHKPVKTFDRKTKTWTIYAGTEEDAFTPYNQPVLNVISCTNIGKVFGGGLGAPATMYADPMVNINMIQGSNHSNIPAATENPNQLGVIGTVYGGGNAADVIGNPTVNIGTAPTVNLTSIPDNVNTTDVDESLKDVMGAYITGNVFGGGKGEADSFTCEKGMVGKDGEGVDNPNGGTTVTIGNGTVMGNVYGGGEIGRVEKNTVVTIGLELEEGISAPIIKGDVFGGGKGKDTHGYAALVRGNPTVIIQGDAKVEHSVYGGGEIASVARYNVPRTEAQVAAAIAQGYDAYLGMPYALANTTSGNCFVTVKGNAVIGPDNAMQMTAAGGPDDAGHVFGAGKGILPKIYTYTDKTTMPRRMVLYDATKFTTSNQNLWEYVSESDHQNVWEYFPDEHAYITFIQTLALSSYTNVTIGDETDSKPFVKGSVYGGSENGLVQFDTNVYIKSGQIGCGKNANGQPHPDAVWADNYTPSADLECASWDYGEDTDEDGTDDLFAPYDPYANATGDLDKYPAVLGQAAKSTEGGRRIASDGHTYYGNVFGGGSGCVPYFDTHEGTSKYLHSAGTVKRNTYVEISGGHILTSVYGGCEATNVLGTANITMTGGTIGVPRTDAQILDHPVTCNLYGAGKGDQRVFFNKDTNVENVVMNINGGRIYGSVFGGGEDGHVMKNVQLTIEEKNNKTITIGTAGTSYMDGNVFGGGRGFGGDALTAGNVGGTVTLNIKSGRMLGSVYGGGRLASVGYGLYLTSENGYGVMREDGKDDNGNPVTGFQRGYITINISGGTIGNDVANAQYGGNVFGGSMGRLTKLDGTPNDLWSLLATAKKTTVNVTGGVIKRSVYGGGEMGTVTTDAEVNVSGGTIGIEGDGGAEYGNVYGGGKGYVDPDGTNYVTAGVIKGNTNVTIENGTNTTPTIYHNVYGGGAYGSVGDFNYDENTGMPTGRKANTTGGITRVTIIGGTIGYNGKENGMIFGSSRGDVGAPGSIHDKLAWVYDTHVTVGTSGQGATLTNPLIKGSIYGSGENGHTYNDAEVIVHNGTIGVNTGETVTYKDDPVDASQITYTGKDYNYPYRGNVYGGGCGTDMYDNNTKYNALAGVVYGDATVTIDGGQIVHNVYGAGAMGSVGLTNNTGAIIQDGTTAIAISGGIVGVDGNGNGNVFGAARGDAASTQTHLAQVRSTSVSMSDGMVYGNVYGGGEAGDVGTYTYDNETKVYTWDKINNIEIGDCTVEITGGTVEGHVFGAGKGEANTFQCEKAMTRTASVSISDGTVNGNVYGGGEVGRVQDEGTNTPIISGNVFGAGAGKETHGYSALVRGNTEVTIQGNAKVVESVYGGGEIASVGRYSLDSSGMPSGLVSGGECKVTITDHAEIGASIFGAGEGVVPHYVKENVDDSKRSRRMDNNGDWEYFDTEIKYLNFLQTLALTTDTKVSIEKHASINGSVYGGSESGFVQRDTDVKIKDQSMVGMEGTTTNGNIYGGGLGVAGFAEAGRVSGNTVLEINGGTTHGSVYGGGARGIVKGGVKVDLLDGVVKKDVYGGGALADTNTGWEEDEEGTTVNLLGGVIEGNAYGGGLGDADIPALVHGDVLVDLNGRTTTITSGSGIVYESTPISTDSKGCIVQQVFGCNNVNGSPQRNVVVHVHATQNPDPTKATINDKPTKNTKNYEMRAVYGGGNQAAYDPVGAHSDNSDVKAAAHTNVIIDGCGLTSIETVYGGGNAASTPATNVTVNGTYEINEVFGGGNGLDAVNGMPNPGANVGYMNYSEYYQEDEVWKVRDKDDAATKEDRLVSSYAYGSGVAALNIFGGLVHKVFGGSNTKGNVRQTAVTMLDDQGCDFCVDEAYGGGKSAPMDAEAQLHMACIPGLKVAYGGAEEAEIQGNVTLNITNGTYERVFGGNNKSGTIRGSITVNIEETGCRPIIIGELYGGGNLAGYSVYGYNSDGTPIESGREPLYDSPQVNVKSFTSIGDIYGGGYGTSAVMVGNPAVNINVTEGTPTTYPTTGDFDNEGYKGTVKTIEGHSVTLPKHKRGEIGAINNVYGGGNAAKVIGNTNVNIGTMLGEKIEMVTMPKVQAVDENNEPVVDGQNNPVMVYQTQEVKGANIIGNVYGGGNNAEVTGDANVQIGK